MLYDITYMWNLKKDTNELIYKGKKNNFIEATNTVDTSLTKRSSLISLGYDMEAQW